MPSQQPNNSNFSSDSNRLSDVDRYLLDDPTFDRDAFELRMADDIQLCEQVAEAVGQIQVLIAAAKSPGMAPTIVVNRPVTLQQNSFESWLYPCVALALAILVSMFSFFPRSSTSSESTNEHRLAMMVDSWVDASTELIDEDSIVANPVSLETSIPADIELDAGESDDWMVDAAREFYLENQNGAAG